MIRRLLAAPPGVLSTGGGAFLAERNREMISRRGISVCLVAELNVLWNRVRHKDTRPLLRGADPKGKLTELYRQRMPIYALADLKVVSDGETSIEAMVDRVLAALSTRPDVLAEA